MPAASFTVVNATTINAVVGAGASGNVSVTTPNGTATLAGFCFPVAAGVSIAASSNPVCTGTNVTFTATPTNGGTPSYQWYKGASPINAATGNTYSSASLQNGDVISVKMTSSLTCISNNPATSNSITMLVNPLANSGTVSGSTPVCFGHFLYLVIRRRCRWHLEQQ